MRLLLLILCALLIILSIVFYRIEKEKFVLRAVQELKVRITGNTDIPDPTDIQSAGDWYYLDHISSGLAYYDSGKKTFLPMLAEKWWEEADGSHIFKLREGIKFHDGTPITTKDIIWSIKRHLIRKTSTHFPLWEYLIGCDHLKTLNDECPGITTTQNNEIIFRLKNRIDSFLLQLASPETGIWAASDMDSSTTKLHPTKFSGPYYIESRSAETALLKRNESSLVSKNFPDSPRSIRLVPTPLTELDNALLGHKVNLVIKQYSPLGETDWEKQKLKARATSPSSIIHFYGAGQNDHPAIGQDLLQALWAINRDPVIIPADTFLPFSIKYGLTREEFLHALPKKSAPKLRVLSPIGSFSNLFLEQIKAAGKSVGIDIQITPVSPDDFFAAFSDPKLHERFDYILSSYAASERYPAVQLRYLSNPQVVPPIDLKKAEASESTEVRKEIFKNYERWLLKTNQTIPIYFDVTLFVYQQNIDIGEQSNSDAEIELWRVRELTK